MGTDTNILEATPMGDHSASLETIHDFLAQKRIAMVGVSREPKDFSVVLFEEFCRRGYDIVPVNPNAIAIMGRRCFSRLQEIRPPVDAAILMTSPAVTDTVVRECAEVGIRRVWMYGAGVQGAVSAEAVEFCRAQGIEVIPGHCPYMFWKDAHLGHRLHGFVWKIAGRYPHRASKQAA
jgi:uncharacterized protein